jgi:hypothetical protein
MVHAPETLRQPTRKSRSSTGSRAEAREFDGTALTFSIGPVGIQVGRGRLVTDLLEGLRRLVIDLEDTARSPPAGSTALVTHIEVVASTARRFGTRVVGNGALEEDWRRQFGGIDGVVERRNERGDRCGWDRQLSACKKYPPSISSSSKSACVCSSRIVLREVFRLSTGIMGESTSMKGSQIRWCGAVSQSSFDRRQLALPLTVVKLEQREALMMSRNFAKDSCTDKRRISGKRQDAL